LVKGGLEKGILSEATSSGIGKACHRSGLRQRLSTTKIIEAIANGTPEKIMKIKEPSA
jgi:hypothetical protein